MSITDQDLSAQAAQANLRQWQALAAPADFGLPFAEADAAERAAVEEYLEAQRRADSYAAYCAMRVEEDEKLVVCDSCRATVPLEECVQDRDAELICLSCMEGPLLAEEER